MLSAVKVTAETLEGIQRRGQLIVAVKDNLRPLGFRGQDGRLQGLEIEIAQRLAQELFQRPDALVLKPVLNRDRLTTVLDGQADLVIAQVSLTEARSRLVTFSLPYYSDGTALITRSAALQKPTDLNNSAIVPSIAVLNGSSAIELLRYRFPKATLVGVESYEAGRQALEQGRAIAFAGETSVLSGWAQEFPGYRLLLPSLSVAPLCVVLPKGLQYETLRQRVNELLARWQQEGWLKERAAYWGLS
ncbi:MAG TPA: transporter substrate-binding domain-containing protein [Thermosynechococcaceae cyanobacterium]